MVNNVCEKHKKNYNSSSNSFRSSDLGVMGPARYHCAMLLCNTFFPFVYINKGMSSHVLRMEELLNLSET